MTPWRGSLLSSPASGPLHLLFLPDFTQPLSLCRDTSLDPKLPAPRQFTLSLPPLLAPQQCSPSPFGQSCCFVYCCASVLLPETQELASCWLRCLQQPKWSS